MQHKKNKAKKLCVVPLKMHVWFANVVFDGRFQLLFLLSSRVRDRKTHQNHVQRSKQKQWILHKQKQQVARQKPKARQDSWEKKITQWNFLDTSLWLSSVQPETKWKTTISKQHTITPSFVGFVTNNQTPKTIIFRMDSSETRETARKSFKLPNANWQIHSPHPETRTLQQSFANSFPNWENWLPTLCLSTEIQFERVPRQTPRRTGQARILHTEPHISTHDSFWMFCLVHFPGARHLVSLHSRESN